MLLSVLCGPVNSLVPCCDETGIEMESTHSEIFIAISQSNFMFVQSDNKNVGLAFCMSFLFSFHLSENLIFIIFIKGSIHSS